MSRLRFALAAVVFLSCMAGCAPARARVTDLPVAANDPVWAELLTWLRDTPLLDTAEEPVATRAFGRMRTTLSVLPGTRLYWGTYRSRFTSHQSLTVLGALRGGKVSIIERPEEWERLRVEAGWQPSTPGAAIEGCVELIASTQPRERPFPMIPYRGSRSFGLTTIFPDSIRRFARMPSARRVGTGWHAELTMIQRFRSITYACDLAGPGGSTYTAVDSLRGGYYAVLRGGSERGASGEWGVRGAVPTSSARGRRSRAGVDSAPHHLAKPAARSLRMNTRFPPGRAPGRPSSPRFLP